MSIPRFRFPYSDRFQSLDDEDASETFWPDFDEAVRIDDDLSADRDDYHRADEDGWFYPDTDPT